MTPSKKIDVEEAKIQASILFKSLRSSDKERRQQALQRLRSLTEFSLLSEAELLQKAKHKHVLQVIAKENGFNTWTELKALAQQIMAEIFARNYQGGFLNKWFAHYEEAKTHQRAMGCYLLPYKHQFFICEADYIKQLGLDPNDPDWRSIDYDWVKPASQKAWQRLYMKWQKTRKN